MAERSWLFVPGDSDKKLGKAAATGADVIIVDLEDSVGLSNKVFAREKTREYWDSSRFTALSKYERQVIFNNDTIKKNGRS